ncbi:unnamed protein product [Linum trigynum]|uniref:Uncharacterized protein n=1 Tax=Linum trigynum TaxID=586398 RepID=A0AAV2FNQ0_9ROSI
MTVGPAPPVAEPDHCLKPPDGMPPDGTPPFTPPQPSKKAKASMSEGFSGGGGGEMVISVTTPHYQNVEDVAVETQGAGENLDHPMEAVQANEIPRISYKDSFLGNGPPIDIPDGDELMSDESEDESTEDDPDCPTIHIKKSTDARIRNRWRYAITFCVLGKSLPFAFVHQRSKNRRSPNWRHWKWILPGFL